MVHLRKHTDGHLMADIGIGCEFCGASTASTYSIVISGVNDYTACYQPPPVTVSGFKITTSPTVNGTYLLPETSSCVWSSAALYEFWGIMSRYNNQPDCSGVDISYYNFKTRYITLRKLDATTFRFLMYFRDSGGTVSDIVWPQTDYTVDNNVCGSEVFSHPHDDEGDIVYTAGGDFDGAYGGVMSIEPHNRLAKCDA